MKTVFKFFGLVLFASFCGSIQAFVVKNKSHHEITILVGQERDCNGGGGRYFHRIAPEKVVVTWIAKSWQNETFPVDDLTRIKVQPSQMADITMSQNMTSCDYYLCYELSDYESRGSTYYLKIQRYNVLPNNVFEFVESVKLTEI